MKKSPIALFFAFTVLLAQPMAADLKLAKEYWSLGEEAFDLFLKAAAQGNSDGENAVGRCYYTGSGVAKNYEKALEWFKKSAD